MYLRDIILTTVQRLEWSRKSPRDQMKTHVIIPTEYDEGSG